MQIPDTGVSIGEAYRALVGWLGDETHITGALWRAQGRLTLAVRSGANTYEFTGPEAALPHLIAQAAERVYRDTQPYRYGVLLMEQGRPEARAVFRNLALNGPASEKPWAWMGWGLTMTGDLKGQLEKERVAASLEPGLPNFASDLADAEFNLGHDEAGLAASRKTVELFQRQDAATQLAPHAANILVVMKSGTVAEILGDYRTAGNFDRQLAHQAQYYGSAKTGAILQSLDLARQHDVAASLRLDPKESSTLAANGGYGLPASLAYFRATLLARWREALNILLAVQRLPLMADPDVRSTLPYNFWPLLADTYAHNGMFHAAHAVDRSHACGLLPLRPYARRHRCPGKALERRRLLVCAGDENGTVHSACRYSDWGEMLLRKGDLDGAIAKFAIANRKARTSPIRWRCGARR